jgi:hypothetical protein
MAALPIKIEHRIGIQTPPEVIWDVIKDIERWPQWNPLYLEAKGRIGFGEILTLTVALPGRQPRVIRPTVTDWTPNEQIIWRLNLFGGLIRTTRYIEVEKLGEESCIFSNGEIFEGPLQGLIGKKLRKSIKAGFTLMGEKVSELAEAAFRDAGAGAT